MTKRNAIVERPLESRILFIRGHKVLLDNDLAQLYGVTVKRLNEQVRRNRERFPEDFVFRVTADEFNVLRSQNATSNGGLVGRFDTRASAPHTCDVQFRSQRMG